MTVGVSQLFAFLVLVACAGTHAVANAHTASPSDPHATAAGECEAEGPASLEQGAVAPHQVRLAVHAPPVSKRLLLEPDATDDDADPRALSVRYIGLVYAPAPPLVEQSVPVQRVARATPFARSSARPRAPPRTHR